MEKNSSAEEWLDELNQLLKQSNPDSRELASGLKHIILEQRSLMEKFFRTIHESSPSGFVHALVLRSLKVPVTGYQEKNFGKFKLNDEVCIHPESQFANLPDFKDESGIIVSFDPENFIGWALVEFPSGHKKPLRYGNPDVDDGVCDLMLLKEALEEQIPTQITSVLYRGEILDVFNYLEIELEAGDTVLLNSTNGIIIGKTESIQSGKVAIIDEILDGKALVSADGTKHIVLLSKSIVCEKGNRVLVDEGMHVILQVLPKSNSIAIISDIESVEWEDVIGLEEAKAAAMELINYMLYPELYRAYYAKEPKGALLVGPSGTGKTRFAKAVATRISRLLGAEDGSIKGFMYIKASEILDMFVGEAPRKIREIFAKAKEYFELTGIKVIIFIDEIEAVLKKRGDKNNGSADEITNAFLTEMDGIQTSYGFIIGATNRADLLDEASTRDKRFDRAIYVGRPVVEDVPKFFELYFKNTVIDEKLTQAMLVDFATKEYLSDEYTFYDLYYTKEGVSPVDESIPKSDRFNVKYFKLPNVGSGAMLEAITDISKLKAIERDLLAKSKKPSGINLDDIKCAVKEAYNKNKLLNLDSAIAEFVKLQKSDPFEIVCKI